MKAVVIGYGRVGSSISKVLRKDGFEVFIYDDAQEKRKMIEQNGFLVYNREIIPEIVIKSPGISWKHPVVEELKEKAEIIDEIEYVYRRIKGKIIAVTGTNGKSTTTALLGEVFKKAGKKVFVGGNLSPGRPFSQALLDNVDYEYYIIEVSSFQIEGIKNFRPDVGIILNITEDHFNRHNKEEYIKLKFDLFKNATKDDKAVLNLDDRITRIKVIKNPESILPKVYWFSAEYFTSGAHLRGKSIFFKREEVMDKKDIILMGKHNFYNALAVITASKIEGIDNKYIKEGIKSFRGLPHRLEFVREINTVKFYNNSMCTNPSAFYASIQAFSKKVIVIVGGKEKGLDITPVIEGIKKYAKYAVLFGENSRKLYNELVKQGYKNIVIVETMDEAVKKAYGKAEREDIVLFSPGFASFDMYQNFEERGDAFKESTRRL